MILGGFTKPNTSVTNLIDLHLNLRKFKIEQELVFLELNSRSLVIFGEVAILNPIFNI